VIFSSVIYENLNFFDCDLGFSILLESINYVLCYLVTSCDEGDNNHNNIFVIVVFHFCCCCSVAQLLSFLFLFQFGLRKNAVKELKICCFWGVSEWIMWEFHI
jgi:hypothetical protein